MKAADKRRTSRARKRPLDPMTCVILGTIDEVAVSLRRQISSLEELRASDKRKIERMQDLLRRVVRVFKDCNTSEHSPLLVNIRDELKASAN